MDIGNQQRVIIVEPEKIEVPEVEPATASARSIFEKTELTGDWPLPMKIDSVPAAEVQH